MLWALASSAFVIYLYRKLNAVEASEVLAADGAQSITSELSKIEEQIARLEKRPNGRTHQ
jgi:hypothetical protein